MNKIIKDCLDMDEWKCSWHNKFDSLADYEKARVAIKDKMAKRIKDLQQLSEGLDKIDIIIAQQREDDEEDLRLERKEELEMQGG